jgi:hypothetical protein
LEKFNKAFTPLENPAENFPTNSSMHKHLDFGGKMSVRFLSKCTNGLKESNRIYWKTSNSYESAQTPRIRDVNCVGLE